MSHIKNTKSFTFWKRSLLVLIAFSLVFAPTINVAYAESLSTIASVAVGGLNEALGYIGNLLVMGASQILRLAGTLLNVSIIITLNIKSFVDNTEAIYSVWQVIRDISGMLFIFFLLYAAFMLIFNAGGYNKLLVNIVKAAILVNFSFFIVSVLIDASNVLSLSIYNAIVPSSEYQTVSLSKSTDISTLTQQVASGRTTSDGKKQGGISDIFMNKLKITQLTQSTNDPLKIILVTGISLIIILTTALSFAAAAVAFIARLIVLLFLLAFSPIYFASMVIDNLKPYSDQYFKKPLTNQLIFMPVYLLLMYAALKILTSSNLLGATSMGLSDVSGITDWAFGYVVLGVNFALVIIFLNMPLFVGLKLGGISTEWMSKATSKIDAFKIWGNVGGWAKGQAGTVPRWAIGGSAAKIDKKLGRISGGTVLGKLVGNSALGQSVRSATVGALANQRYGTSKSYGDYQKYKKEIAGTEREIGRVNALSQLVRTGNKDTNAYKDIISKMSEKEKLALRPEILTNPEVLKHLKSDDFKAIKKSDDIKDEVKNDVKKGRLTALVNAVADKDPSTGRSRQSNVIKSMVKNLDTDELIDLDTAILTDPELVAHLTTGNLKSMADAGLSQDTKNSIGNIILDWQRTKGTPHSAGGYIKKNKLDWVT